MSPSVERGSRTFGIGDRIMFLKNERSLGMKNSSLGTVRTANPISMAIMLDDGRAIAEMREFLDDNQRSLAALQQSASLRITPAALVADIHAAAEAVRAEDRRMLDASREAIDRSVGAINAIVQRGQASDWPPSGMSGLRFDCARVWEPFAAETRKGEYRD